MLARPLIARNAGRAVPGTCSNGCGAKAASAIRRADFAAKGPYIMSVDATTVRRIAHLARIAVTEAEVPHLQGELNAMLAFVEQLSEVNVDGVEPMTSVTPMEMKKRADVVNDGEIADDVVRNAPDALDHFFLVPKVVE
jgi:aspartyl-tRNA(Asn)/glutamyl-tRNA(Gln) amidotransferase subunit C